MQGYGFSVWVVPHNHGFLAHRYNMKHIPHVTLETNLVTPKNKFDKNFCKIYFKNFCSQFPSMYETDPMTACGFYCDIDIPIDFDPHMTLWYNHPNPSPIMDIPEPTHGQVFMADTRSMDPSEWKIIL